MRSRSIAAAAILVLVAAALATPWLLAPGAPAGASDAARRMAVRDRIAGIDPLHCGGPGNGTFALSINVFETLYQYHHLRRPYAIIPGIAAGMPAEGGDGLRWTIRLRGDVRFHDDACFVGGRGRALNAADVAATLLRIADPRAAATAWPLLAGRIEGLDAYRDALAAGQAAPAVPGIAALDDLTLQLRLTRPWPQLPLVLAHPGTGIVAPEAVARYGAAVASHPVGTGPYRLAELVPNVRVVLTRVADWRGEAYPSDGEAGDADAGLLRDAGRTMPFIDRLEYTCVQADQSSWLLFRSGALDCVGIPGASWSEVMGADRRLRPEMAAQGLEVEVHPAMFSRWIGFDMGDPLIGGNLPLRRAISLAIDRDCFNRTFLSSRSDLPRGIIPRGLAEHRPDLADPWMRFDLAEARRQVAEAERIHGGPLPVLSMRFGGKGPVQRQVGDLMQRWFADAGLGLRIEYEEEDALRAGLRDRPAQLSWGLGYSMRIPDPSDVFKAFRSGDALTNPFRYTNPEFDAIYDEVTAMPPGERRTAACHRLEDIILADLPCAVMLDYTWVSLRHDWLRNRKPHALYGLGGPAKYERLDAGLRARYGGMR